MRTRYTSVCIASCLIVAVSAAAVMLEGSRGDGPYDITQHVIASGGGTSVGGAYEIDCTIGQPNVGTMTGGPYALSGGYVAGGQIEPGTPCPADISGDQLVDGQDLSELLGAWGACADCDTCPADISGDCQVDGQDLSELLGAWGACPE